MREPHVIQLKLYIKHGHTCNRHTTAVVGLPMTVARCRRCSSLGQGSSSLLAIGQSQLIHDSTWTSVQTRGQFMDRLGDMLTQLLKELAEPHGQGYQGIIYKQIGGHVDPVADRVS